jgi:hypothetical protein
LKLQQYTKNVFEKKEHFLAFCAINRYPTGLNTVGTLYDQYGPRSADKSVISDAI